MKEKLDVHPFEWNDQTISRFWNTIYELAPPGTGFAETSAKSLVKYVKSKAPVTGNILDYGSGNGYLVDVLLEQYPKSKIHGCDFSQEAVEMVNHRLENKENFGNCFKIQGFPFPAKENTFDCIFTLEVIEHLTDDVLLPTLKEFHRMLKPHGIVIISVPNNEDIEARKVICPGCGASFHPIQHVRSFNRESLPGLLSSCGFKTHFCNEIFLGHITKKSIKTFLKNIYYRTMRKSPNLVYAGEKI